VYAFALYGCLGTTTEVFFTAMVDMISGDAHDLRLKGVSYIWMFPIYGITAFVFPIGYERVKRFNVLVRSLFYGLAIMTVELVAGFLLEQLTGRCPWQYQTGWHVGGYVRLDYLPLWMLFGAVIEAVHRINRKIGLEY